MYWTLLSQSEDDDCILSVAELQGLRIQRSTARDKIVNVTVRELGVVCSLAQYVQPEITVMMRCHRGITSSSCAFDATLCLRSLALDCNAGTKKADTALDAERGAAG